MSKREKILILCCLLAAVGTVALYFPDMFSGDRAAKRLSERTEKLEQIEKNARNLPISLEIGRKEQYVLTGLGKDWPRDPFLNLSTLQEGEAPKGGPALVYNGFIAMGNKSFAIINGAEYMVGETVADTRLKVTSVGQQRVVLTGDNNIETVLVLQE
jgi:hypothetical protein